MSAWPATQLSDKAFRSEGAAVVGWGGVGRLQPKRSNAAKTESGRIVTDMMTERQRECNLSHPRLRGWDVTCSLCAP